MKYDLFLFDLDDTLLDFKESERLSFASTLESFGIGNRTESLYAQYQVENRVLWREFEQGRVTKEFLREERFRRIFAKNDIDLDISKVSTGYLEALPESVVLVDYAIEICQWLSGRGEIGIITNGIQSVQNRRIQNSALAPYVSFVSTSEGCGYAKPDARFFAYATKMAKKFDKASTIIVGDRLEADILGAHNFGIDSCWYNPEKAKATQPSPSYEIHHLSELRNIFE